MSKWYRYDAKKIDVLWKLSHKYNDHKRSTISNNKKNLNIRYI